MKNIKKNAIINIISFSYKESGGKEMGSKIRKTTSVCKKLLTTIFYIAVEVNAILLLYLVFPNLQTGWGWMITIVTLIISLSKERYVLFFATLVVLLSIAPQFMTIIFGVMLTYKISELITRLWLTE